MHLRHAAEPRSTGRQDLPLWMPDYERAGLVHGKKTLKVLVYVVSLDLGHPLA
jgi:hypothetical protein